MLREIEKGASSRDENGGRSKSDAFPATCSFFHPFRRREQVGQIHDQHDGKQESMRPSRIASLVSDWPCVLWLASFGYAQRDVPRPVSDFLRGLETDLTSTIDVAGLLAQSRRDVCALLRYYGPAAKAWQLEPALAKEMGDDELFEFVVIRATSALAGGCDLLSRYDLRNLSFETIEKSKVSERYWSETSEGHCHISHDGVSLTDSEGRPIVLRNRSDLKDYWKLQKRFKTKNQPFCFGKRLGYGNLSSKSGLSQARVRAGFGGSSRMYQSASPFTRRKSVCCPTPPPHALHSAPGGPTAKGDLPLSSCVVVRQRFLTPHLPKKSPTTRTGTEEIPPGERWRVTPGSVHWVPPPAAKRRGVSLASIEHDCPDRRSMHQ